LLRGSFDWALAITAATRKANNMLIALF